jgi:periplasmic protein TonB
MGADAKVQAAVASGAARAPLKAVKPRERAFWLALGWAVVAHVVLIAGFVHSLPKRQMGEKGGVAEGVSVAMVDAADLASMSSFAERARPPRSVPQLQPVPPSPQPVPRLEEQPRETARQAAPRPNAERAPELVAPDEAARQAEKQSKEAAEQKQEMVPWPIDLKALEQDFSADRPAKSRDAAASKQAAKPEQQQMASAVPHLQLTLPDSAIPLDELLPFSRPAGITKSGENFEFGRGVIRALYKTMPQEAARGRVTVRLLLSQEGNLIEVRLARSSGNPMLDQAVLFAVQQTSFPFPPPNSPPVDRTFLVTYVYDTRGDTR